MIIKTIHSSSGFIELKTDQIDINCFTRDGATDIILHLEEVIYELNKFIDNKK